MICIACRVTLRGVRRVMRSAARVMRCRLLIRLRSHCSRFFSVMYGMNLWRRRRRVSGVRNAILTP